MSNFQEAKDAIYAWYENLGDSKRSILLNDQDSYISHTVQPGCKLPYRFSLYRRGSVHLLREEFMNKEEEEDFRKLLEIFRDYLSGVLEENEKNKETQ
jgi:hypothetical protein